MTRILTHTLLLSNPELETNVLNLKALTRHRNGAEFMVQYLNGDCSINYDNPLVIFTLG